MKKRERKPQEERQVGLLVQKKRCNECLYSSQKIVSDERREQIIEDCLEKDHFFVCHKGSLCSPKKTIVCRGFYDAHKKDVLPLRIAEMLGGIIEVEEKGPVT